MPGRIVVDWGSSNFRAYRFDARGEIADRHQANAGILTVTDGDFETVLMREAGHWIDAATEVMLSGMITSRNGWVETSYIEAPATLAQLAEGAIERKARNGACLRFLPGVCVRAPQPDAMRGEEIQVFGATAPGESAIVILPGTHSKWVDVRNGAITGFRTYLTGETFALLKGHSIIGRLMPPGDLPFGETAFRAGVRQAHGSESAGLLNDVFTARSGALLGAFGIEEIADRLSGILVGHELRDGLRQRGASNIPLRLVGEAALIARYRIALDELGVPSEIGPDHAAVAGFRRLTALALQ